MKKPESFEYVKSSIRRDGFIEDLKKRVDSYRDKALLFIKEYKGVREEYNVEVNRDKELIEYIEYLEGLADSVQ